MDLKTVIGRDIAPASFLLPSQYPFLFGCPGVGMTDCVCTSVHQREEARMAAHQEFDVLTESSIAPTIWDHNPACIEKENEAASAEKRRWDRRTTSCPLQMIQISSAHAPHSSDALGAECLNIGEGGFYGTVPVGYGMGVGQYYVFRMRDSGLKDGGEHTVLRQGVIVRTELLLSPHGCDHVGFAVRFSHDSEHDGSAFRMAREGALLK